MIKSKSDLNLLCQKHLDDLTEQESRLLIFNYIYYLKGVGQPAVFTAKINFNLRFATNIHKVYRYFKNI